MEPPCDRHQQGEADGLFLHDGIEGQGDKAHGDALLDAVKKEDVAKQSPEIAEGLDGIGGIPADEPGEDRHKEGSVENVEKLIIAVKQIVAQLYQIVVAQVAAVFGGSDLGPFHIRHGGKVVDIAGCGIDADVMHIPQSAQGEHQKARQPDIGFVFRPVAAHGVCQQQNRGHHAHIHVHCLFVPSRSSVKNASCLPTSASRRKSLPRCAAAAA